MEGIGKLTYELPSTNILNQVTLKHQYTHSMIENNAHAFFFSFFFKYIQNVHALNANEEAPKMRLKMDKHTLKC